MHYLRLPLVCTLLVTCSLFSSIRASRNHGVSQEPPILKHRKPAPSRAGSPVSPGNLEGEHRRSDTHGIVAENNYASDSFQHTLDLHSEEPSAPAPPLEVQPLIVSGPSSNRVDLVFFADGYLEIEKEKFFKDAQRLAEDITGNQTFNTVKPLMNLWAAFTPSAESGVGVGGIPKDTVFGLYRPGTELRGVYYDKPDVASAACSSLGDQCDYPILMGNDPLYGGLGGRFTVITPSIANGALILRHELGHSIIPVGEEYDGGFAYFGVNSFDDLSEPVPWTHWMADAPVKDEPTRVERWMMSMQDYAWTMLNTTKPWSTTFNSSGTYSRAVVRMSLSGLPEATDLRIELDGKELDWKPKVGLGLDRWHYDIPVDHPLSDGEHTLKYTLLNAEREGVAQMCSAEIMEFGDESEFISKPGYYGVFPTYSDSNTTTYRPTNEDCLMRIVTTPNFCKVCIEGLWHALLGGIDLIDGLDESCDGSNTTLSLSLVPLAQLRDVPITAKESLAITWFKDSQVLPEFANATTLSIDGADAIGDYTVAVKYTTEEVRVEKGDVFSDKVVYTVTEAC